MNLFVVAVVTLLLRDPKTGASFVKTATIMRRGMSFGVTALEISNIGQYCQVEIRKILVFVYSLNYV